MLSFAYLMASGAGNGGQQSLTGMLLPMIMIIAVMYFLIFRPQAKKQKQQRTMLESLKKGDKIITVGGIYGTIAGVKEQSLIVKVDDNVKIEIARGSVARKIEDAK